MSERICSRKQAESFMAFFPIARQTVWNENKTTILQKKKKKKRQNKMHANHLPDILKTFIIVIFLISEYNFNSLH